MSPQHYDSILLIINYISLSASRHFITAPIAGEHSILSRFIINALPMRSSV